MSAGRRGVRRDRDGPGAGVERVGHDLGEDRLLGGPRIRVPQVLEQVKKIVNDPAVDVHFTAQNIRPASTFDARLDSEPYKVLEAAARRIYDTITVPTMSTGATDMAPLRARGVQCFGIGAAIDAEDGPKGFGMHSDQERLLESELHRFVRFNWDVISNLARTK